MSIYEEDIIILLRKLVAISLPQSFDATEDTSRIVLLDKLKRQHKQLFIVVDNFYNCFRI